MPHQCTGCDHVFDDGSKEMLSGCPDCGGNKFQFIPDGNGTATASNSGRSGPDTQESGDDEATDLIDADEMDDGDTGLSREDRAQASARSAFAADHELPSESRTVAGGSLASGESAESTPADPGLAGLRKELNEQFESIKILQPGQYELNLMELYDREEYIIALKEDGRYVIEVPGEWGG